jgi:hypothetical protein
MPCCGLFVAGVRLIDVAPFPAWFSRHMLGLDPIFIPMGVRDPGRRLQSEPRSPEPGPALLTTVTHGTPVKFADDGPVAFAHTIAHVLTVTGGRHIHVGPIPKPRLARLRAALQQYGIAGARFEHVKWVPSLAPFLVESGIDLSLGSFPLGGARGIVETLAAGTPHVWFLPDPSHAPWRLHLQYPGAASWSNLVELGSLLHAAGPDWIRSQAGEARAWFLERHSFEGFRSRLASLPDSLPETGPPNARFGSNPPTSNAGVADDEAVTRRQWIAAMAEAINSPPVDPQSHATPAPPMRHRNSFFNLFRRRGRR